MKVRLPYSKNRRYLTGIDWVIGALDIMSRRSTGGGNTFQVVLELKGAFDKDRVQQAVQSFVQQFPILGGYPSRDWTLAPYWKIPPPRFPVPVVFEFRQVPEVELFPVLEQSANIRFPDSRTHLAFRVFHTVDDRHVVAVQFDHAVFDASGAESFLGLFHQWSAGEDCRARIAKIPLKEPAHLDDWRKRFNAGKQLVRLLHKLSETALVVLPRPTPLQGRAIKFQVLEFNAEASRAIAERANREAGFLMFMPYALAASLEAMAPVFVRRKKAEGTDFLVSVSVDLRTPDTAPAAVFFNHISFLFFQVPVAIMGDRKQVLETIRLQMYDQVKSGFPKAMADSSMLMRILPVSVLSRIMLKPLRGEFASLGFTCVGKGGYPFARFMGADLVNLLHMPLVPVPPGIGFFINQFGSKMNAVLSYVEGMLDDDDLRHIRDEVRRRL